MGHFGGRTRCGRTRLILAEPDPVPAGPTHEEIARLAYTYWQARHGAPGSELEDWLRAEAELKRRSET